LLPLKIIILAVIRNIFTIAQFVVDKKITVDFVYEINSDKELL